ncbi:MAG: hypothetical protein IPN62_03660 [Flavobacteriales bacterium]|nr:hypothetical protein [Flavobacteriales bacterium]
MKWSSILVVVSFLFVLSDVHAQEMLAPCGADELHQERLVVDPGYAARHEAFERGILQRADGTHLAHRDGEVLMVPVVVHIIHDNGAENLLDAQVLAAIQYLNDGFANVGLFDPLTGVDVGIQFCMAQRTPDGLATNGIVRVQSVLTDLVMEDQDAALKDLSRWTPTEYLNIWVVNSITSIAQGPGVAGYATLPGSHGQANDGIVVEANGFGSTVNDTKVTVHEVGHYLGLYHTFQGECANSDCQQQGDRVCDTPPDGSTSIVNCGSSINTCTTDADDTSLNNPFRPVALGGLGDQNDMFINHMDYGDIACHSAFTEGQKLRMRNALTSIRSSLLSSLACQTPCDRIRCIVHVYPCIARGGGTEVTFINTTVRPRASPGR